jgi:hypothetical protein
MDFRGSLPNASEDFQWSGRSMPVVDPTIRFAAAESAIGPILLQKSVAAIYEQ